MWKTLGIIAFSAAVTASGADFEAGKSCFEARRYGCAVQEWTPLAARGVAQAQYNLGLLYARGEGVRADPARASQLYERAAEAGVVQAQYNVALAYLSGVGVEKDENKAISWFQKAAELGDPNAANNLATILEAHQDFASALSWFRRAATAGLPSAEFSLGKMYDLGHGVPQNFAEARLWYEKAAEKGDSASLCNLAILYYNGDGVRLDRGKAYTYLLLARKVGDPRASNLLGMTAEKLGKKQIEAAANEAETWLAAHPLRERGNEFAAPAPIVKADAKLAPAFPTKASGLD